MKNSQRNFYRILQIQPDAPLGTIKNNYRTLLHKLRLHPDLGGENNTASAINLAYATLRNSVKRASYDRKLLAQYKIEVLSKGHLSHIKLIHQIPKNIPLVKNSNQRNYYRILHIQPDAPTAIIFSSYQLLLKNKETAILLVEEAYSVLSNPQKRKQYDQLLRQNHHSRVSPVLNNKKNTRYKQKQFKIKTKNTKRYSSCSSLYQPLITHYCDFCKTPQSFSATKYIDELCIECFSPLYSSKEYLSIPRRYFSRIKLSSTMAFYTYWPSNRIITSLSDLSPTGLRFTTKQNLNKNQVIKIDADQFRAVGKVKHQKPKGASNIIGIEFITIQFNTHQGIFVSESA
ncbi:MAG: DnaJ domain-containing protein [Methylococcales bacterium]|nr:DnaJ domain-containing protein [Methylococcales bacterium]